jgi:hypothetical protein
MHRIRSLAVSVAQRMASAPWLRRRSAAAITPKVSASPSLRVPPEMKVGDAAEALIDHLHAVAPPARPMTARARTASQRDTRSSARYGNRSAMGTEGA